MTNAALPITVRVLQALGAWFCAILLMIAVTVGPTSLSGEDAALMLSPLFAIAGYWLASRQQGGFLADMGVPLCMAGVGLLPAVFEVAYSERSWWNYLDLIYGLPALAVWWLTRNAALRFVAALVLAVIAWYWIGLDMYWFGYRHEVSQFSGPLRNTLLVAALAWWWLNPPAWGERLLSLRLALVLVALGFTLSEHLHMWRSANLPWQQEGWMLYIVRQQLLPTLALVLVVLHGLRREQIALRLALPWLAVIPLLLMSELFLYPVLLLWLAMLVPGRQRLLVVLGGAGALYAFSRFYYQLDWALLHKGGVLIVAGLALLGLAALVRKEALQ